MRPRQHAASMPRWARCARYPWNVVPTQPVRAMEVRGDQPRYSVNISFGG